MKVKEYLENKNILFFGDSITHNWLKYGHNLEVVSDTTKYSGYVGIIDDSITNKTIVNKAVSGGCYASTTYLNEERQEFRHFNYQVDHSIDDIKKANVIFVFFGTNDYSEQVMFGKDDDRSNDNHSFYSAMNNGFDKIQKANPSAKIFVLTCLKRNYPVDGKNPYSYSIDEYNLAIKQCCRVHNIEVIDTHSLFTNESYKIYSDDGLHPNALGYKELANYILEHEVK